MISAADEKKAVAVTMVTQNKENDFNLYNTYIRITLNTPDMQRKLLVTSL